MVLPFVVKAEKPDEEIGGVARIVARLLGKFRVPAKGVHTNCRQKRCQLTQGQLRAARVVLGQDQRLYRGVERYDDGAKPHATGTARAGWGVASDVDKIVPTVASGTVVGLRLQPTDQTAHDRNWMKTLDDEAQGEPNPIS
uniref:Uncharacterized protein n=1 Tax=Anopheles coluzzii TaxID=1518534 RepID=A0A8W7PY96_ANOCL